MNFMASLIGDIVGTTNGLVIDIIKGTIIQVCFDFLDGDMTKAINFRIGTLYQNISF